LTKGEPSLLAQSHRQISNFIIQEMKYSNLITLDEKQFSWGSVKPDYALPPFRRKHYMEETLEDVLEMIMTVSNATILLPSSLSEAIGEITHYLTDFFTMPHSERWEFIKSGKTFEHITYEKRLNQKIKDKSQSIMTIPLLMSECWEKEDLRAWILDCHKKYQLKTDYEQDLLYATSVSFAVTKWIAEKRQKPTKQIILY